jgi:alpha-L-arabinofuranosidase
MKIGHGLLPALTGSVLGLCFGFCAPAADLPPASLQNAGFEADSPTNGWEVHVYGARPQITLDRVSVREGSQALRIAATEPSDTALGQEITLQGGAGYRFSGWVRTAGLRVVDAPVLGTLQVQQAGGRGIIASGANHEGDTDWTLTPVYFQAPADGRVRVCLFFAGFGKGTGAAWFDGLKIERVDVSKLPARITRTPLCAGEISPFQYGQFIEYLCDLVPSMWAEKLYDGSFEGLSPYKFTFIKETDFKEKPWYPSGACNRARWSRDSQTRVSGAASQKIEILPGPPATAGVSQDGIFVEADAPCRFSCWLRARDFSGPVHVRLEADGETLAHGEFQVSDGADWKKYSARLVPRERALRATLTIEFRGPGTLWLDNASLMPTNTVGGWRRDAFEAVRALRPGIIRFGGSVVEEPGYGDFDWKKTIGDPDRRRPFRAWGGLQPTGPGLEEIVQFIQAVGAEPLMCVRFKERTPQDAAQEVEYFNGATNTPMGALRAANGHPELYRLRYWQIGNEVGGPDYDQRLAAFCQAVRATDPSIKLLTAFPSADTVRNAARWLDYLCPHHYGCANLAAMEGDFAHLRRLMREGAPDRPLRVAVTEWNTTAGDWDLGRASLWTLANALACSRYHNLLHRQCDLVEIANRSNLANSFCSGIIQSDTHRLYKTPTYYAQQLYATLAGTRPLRIDSEVPPNAGLDLSATLMPDGRAVVLFAVNDTLKPITRPLDFSAFGSERRTVEVITLADRDQAGEPDVTNSFNDPDRMTPRTAKLQAASGKFDYQFPPLSLTVLSWK